VTDEDAAVLARLLQVRNYDELAATHMNGVMRQRLMEWYLQFLHRHTEHMSPLKSLAVLQSILH
jgi:hypothetical protein